MLLPLEFRFDCDEVYIRRDPVSGDVVLSQRPDSWDGLFSLYATTDVPADFMGEADRALQTTPPRDPFGDLLGNLLGDAPNDAATSLPTKSAP